MKRIVFEDNKGVPALKPQRNPVVIRTDGNAWHCQKQRSKILPTQEIARKATKQICRDLLNYAGRGREQAEFLREKNIGF